MQRLSAIWEFVTPPAQQAAGGTEGLRVRGSVVHHNDLKILQSLSLQRLQGLLKPAVGIEEGHNYRDQGLSKQTSIERTVNHSLQDNVTRQVLANLEDPLCVQQILEFARPGKFKDLLKAP